MKPLFFGEAERRLYGVYHPAAKPSRHAVLLCYPGMQEYNAAHWMFRRLATSLSREGHHVLRFDYFGTGDSDGDSDVTTPESAVADVHTAIRELRDLSRAREISLVGLRFGAACAALACSSGSAARQLVLWEPVIYGHAYVRELEAQDERRNLVLLHAERTRGRRNELLGFPFNARVRAGTEAINLTTGSPVKAKRVVVLCSDERNEHRALRDWYERSGVPTELRAVQEPDEVAGHSMRERPMLSNAVLLELAAELRGSLVG
ncbi:MAG TPA: alpha/beta fold hydrolase [Polyangiaceae bacterium]|nr:alpha/beta fold hydrolase [Polyangiaceae bacterium]